MTKRYKRDITIVAAVAANGVIGSDNKLLWDYPNDMKRFVELTTGKIIVMGRKTHESIGCALPNRTNIVITHDLDYKSPVASPGAITLANIDSVLAISEGQPIVIIGGGQIYKEFLSYAHTMHITNISAPFAGDTYFPEVSHLDWFHTYNEVFKADEKHRFPYEFNTYKKYEIS